MENLTVISGSGERIELFLSDPDDMERTARSIYSAVRSSGGRSAREIASLLRKFFPPRCREPLTELSAADALKLASAFLQLSGRNDSFAEVTAGEFLTEHSGSEALKLASDFLQFSGRKDSFAEVTAGKMTEREVPVTPLELELFSGQKKHTELLQKRPEKKSSAVWRLIADKLLSLFQKEAEEKRCRVAEPLAAAETLTPESFGGEIPAGERREESFPETYGKSAFSPPFSFQENFAADEKLPEGNSFSDRSPGQTFLREEEEKFSSAGEPLREFRSGTQERFSDRVIAAAYCYKWQLEYAASLEPELLERCLICAGALPREKVRAEREEVSPTDEELENALRRNREVLRKFNVRS